MAKKAKSEVNKSQAIRDYLAENNGAKAAAIVAGLAEKGITVGTPLVYAILSKGGKKKRRKISRPKTTKSSNGNGKVSLETLLAAKRMSEALGGVDKAKAALDVLARLV